MTFKTVLLNLFSVIFLAFFIIYMYSTQIVTIYANQQESYKANVRSSAEAALNEARNNVIEEAKTKNKAAKYNLFDSEEKRADTLNKFYDTFAIATNQLGDEADRFNVEDSFPLICLVDFNGFYLTFEDEYDAGDKDRLEQDEYGGGYYRYDGLEVVTTKINTWSESIPGTGLIIQYYLGDDNIVKVIDTRTGKSVEDRYDKACEAMDSVYLNDYIGSFEVYNEHKTDIIYNTTVAAIQQYINDKNYKANGVNNTGGMSVSYTVDFTKEIDTAVMNLLDMPAVIAFYQGDSITDMMNHTDYNIYAISGFELESGNRYYITNNTNVSGSSDPLDTFDSQHPYTYHLTEDEVPDYDNVVGNANSKEDAARQGAFPDKLLQ